MNDKTYGYGYGRLTEDIKKLSAEHGGIFRAYVLGKSLLGRDIPLISLGKGDGGVLYVGTHHGMESICSEALMRFCEEYCDTVKAECRIFGFDSRYLFRRRRIYIVPMLNPDGAELCLYGPGEDCPLKERLSRMNGGSDDFSHWQANARGVDLNHNYDAGFDEYKVIEEKLGIYGGAPTRFSGEFPGSEPETAALIRLIRADPPRSLLSLHTQGAEIYYDFRGSAPLRARSLGRILSRMSGYRLASPSGAASYGGLKDWFIREFERPAFTIECGRGENPLPESERFPIYSALRQIFFSFPLLI